MADHLVRVSAGITTDDQTNATERRKNGEFVRGVSSARNFVGEQDTNTGVIAYPVESRRYHLYVAYNCPWCHRVLLGRAIMGLEDVISVDVLFPNRSTEDEPLGANLWKFKPNGTVGLNGQHVLFPSCTVDTVMNKKYIKEIYEAAGITDQTSVPILFDKTTKTVVNNESAEILRMFGTVFRPLAKYADTIELYPQEKTSEINEINDWIYTDIANGAYKAGFSSNQVAYENAYNKFFMALERLDHMLSEKIYLVGDNVSEADVRLFPTLFRFDPVYYIRFKLNKKMLWEYIHVWRWMGVMMCIPGMGNVANEECLQQCKQGYFGRTGNGTIPLGPPGYPACYLEKHRSHLQPENSDQKEQISNS
jgi:glutathionyl-hydroquinone reductase